MEITIRPYEDRDWKTVVDFGNDLENHVASLDPVKQRRFYEEGSEEYTKWLFEELRKNDGIVFIAEDDGKAVGHIAACWNPQNAEDLLFSIPTEKRVWVHDLYVIPAYRSRGVGAQLLKRVEDHYKALGCQEISLEAFAPNERALTFYDQQGYSRQAAGFIKRL